MIWNQITPKAPAGLVGGKGKVAFCAVLSGRRGEGNVMLVVPTSTGGWRLERTFLFMACDKSVHMAGRPAARMLAESQHATAPSAFIRLPYTNPRGPHLG
jgi:hypothetical protein